jgi:hypothetical protein
MARLSPYSDKIGSPLFVGAGFIPARAAVRGRKTGGDKPRPYEEGGAFRSGLDL